MAKGEKETIWMFPLSLNLQFQKLLLQDGCFQNQSIQITSNGKTKAKVVYDGWIEPEGYNPDDGKVSLTSYTKELLSLPSDARPNIKPYWLLNGKTLTELCNEWEDAGFPDRSGRNLE